MRIEVANLKRDGVQVDLGATSDGLRAAAAVALEGVLLALDGELSVTAEGGLAKVGGRVSARVGRGCERCGSPLELEVAGEVDLAYMPESSDPDGGEHELSPADLDLGWYREGLLDLTDVLSEALALQLPPLVACTDEAACTHRTMSLLAQHGHSGDEGGLSGLGALLNKG